MECIKATFLTHISGPRFATVEQCAEYTGLIDADFGVRSEALVIPNPLRQFGHGR